MSHETKKSIEGTHSMRPAIAAHTEVFNHYYEHNPAPNPKMPMAHFGPESAASNPFMYVGESFSRDGSEKRHEGKRP